MAQQLRLEIVTPEGRTLAEEIDMITLPAAEGEMGVYPMHVPLLTQIVPGEITVRKGMEEYHLAVGEGFVEITGDHVSVLTDMAIRAADIDEAKAEEARRAAEARLREKISDEEAAVVAATLARSLAQLHVKRRRRS